MEVPPYLTIDQAYCLSQMIDIRKERLARWQVYLVDNLPKISDFNVTTIMGAFSRTQLVTRKKWILSDKAIDYGGGYCTEMDIARDYLTYRYPKKRRITTSQYNQYNTQRVSAPLYAKPCELHDAVYVDIKAAYWQIVSTVGWDVDYLRHGYIIKRSDNSDFPFPELKLARNALVSMTRNSNIVSYYPKTKTFKSRKIYNKFLNDGLWHIVMDILNTMAYEMIMVGAVYVHTDGYILPYSRLNDAIEVAQSWGLNVAVKYRGFATVYRVGRYAIGTKNAGTKSNYRRHFNKVYAVNSWLKKRYVLLQK